MGDATTKPGEPVTTNGGASAARAGVVEIPWNLHVPEVDVYLVGYGMRLPNDITLEALAVLQRCKRVFGVPPIHAPEFNIPPMENLLYLYAPDKVRMKTYHQMVDIVLDAATADPPVALATYGSAVVGVFPTHHILEQALERHLTVHVTNAPSSFDGIWADFNIEPFFGFEIWEATMFVRLEIEPNTRAHLLLPQAPVFGVKEGFDVTKGETIEASSSVQVLRQRLLKFYPPDHVVHFIRTGSGTGPRAAQPDVESMLLADLDHAGRHVGSTLLVPRAKPLGMKEFEFQTRLQALRADLT